MMANLLHPIFSIMTNTPSPTILMGLRPDELRRVAVEHGLPAFAGKQMAEWLYRRHVGGIDAMTNISKVGRERLAAHCTVGAMPPAASQRSVDGTVKYLFPTAAGHFVESVYIPDGDRATLCVSSQAGCKMHCAFCMTGRQGFHGNLSAANIINQVLSVENSEKLTNLVFMGMGEPCDNLPAVLQAIEVLTAPWGLAWSPKRITVSSIGKLPEMRELIKNTRVHIALSVHAPFPSEREQLMPAQKAWPLTKVMDMLRQFDFAHQRRLSVEYIMWDGVNDDQRHADALARHLRATSARVNLIRFHAIPGSELRPSPRPVMEAFRDRLNSLGITATIRASRGEDIMAACGMLAGKNNETP